MLASPDPTLDRPCKHALDKLKLTGRETNITEMVIELVVVGIVQFRAFFMS